MKIHTGLIIATAFLAIAGCGASEEPSRVFTPGYTGIGETFHESEEGTEVAVAPESGEETDVAVGPSEGSVEGSDAAAALPTVPMPPEGETIGEVFHPDYSRYFGRLFGSPLPSSTDAATITPGGMIAMPAPTRVFRLTSLEWIYTGGATDTGGRSQVLSCYDRETHPTGVLAGFIHQYSGEGNILGMRGVCEDVAEDGRLGHATGVEGLVESVVASVTELVGSGEPYYWRRCDADEGGVGIFQRRTGERVDQLDMYCSTGETGPRFDPANHTDGASVTPTGICPDGKFLFGVVVRYDWRGIRFVDAIGCAKPAWVPVN